MIENPIEKLKTFREKKRFVTRGASFAKKMWRDGYNKALDDVITFLEMEEEERVVSGRK